MYLPILISFVTILNPIYDDDFDDQEDELLLGELIFEEDEDYDDQNIY